MHRNISKKKLFIFDLDGTLTESKSRITPKMAGLLELLLADKKVAVISGGKFNQFKKQLLAGSKISKRAYSNLTAFPTNSTSHYVFKNNKWVKMYEEKLSLKAISEIINSLKELQKSSIYVKPQQAYGKMIENRGTQISFSATGQSAPLVVKRMWNKFSNSRAEYINFLKKKLKNFAIKSAGLTSIDINHKGIDKSYGVKKILKELNIRKTDAVFIGDAFYSGGNDAPARKAGIDCIPVSGPKDTEKIIIEALK